MQGLPQKPIDCPVDLAFQAADALAEHDLLVLPLQKRMVVQYGTSEEGLRELRLFYGAKEVSFDEPDLFAFGETLARQSRFEAGVATGWGEGYDWPLIRDLLAQLLAEGILKRAEDEVTEEAAALHRAQPSPLPPSTCPFPRTWAEAEAITHELTGRSVELGHLELFLPIFRVAHASMDSDGRHVGEANVFPRALRTETPTDWMTCIYPGTRYLADAPMNVTALKAMRAHWPQMMAALLKIRERFLSRFPEARKGWTVGHLERLATAVLCVPTYQLMRQDRPVRNGDLHPALSSLFRVTDGLRMVMHQMLFVPVGEPTLSPHDPVSSAEIHAYAERNFSFFSDTGVCAGPKLMVQEFLSVLVDGAKADQYGAFAFDPAVAGALEEADKAIDYALLGLQAYAATFSLWPLMTRTYEALAEVAKAAVEGGETGFLAFHKRMDAHRERLRTSPYLAREAWRADRDHVYADMYAECGRGVSDGAGVDPLPALIAPEPSAASDIAETTLRAVLAVRLGSAPRGNTHLDALVAQIMDYALRTQAILRTATATQTRINTLLGREAPKRAFAALDMDVHNLLQGAEARRLPYLLDELAAAFDLEFDITADYLAIFGRAEPANG